MKVAIVLLLLVGIVLASHPVLPGTRDSNAGVGWDLKYIQVKREHVLDFEFKKQAVYHSLRRPARIPDQLTITELHEQDSQVLIFQDEESLREYQNNLHGTSSDTAQPTFEDDYLSKAVLKAIQKEKTAVVIKVQKRIFGWTFNEAKVSKEFTKAVAKIPSTYDSENDRKAYSDFIERFGTHVLTSAEVGGEIAHVYSVPTAFFDFHGKDWIVERIKEHINLRSTGKSIAQVAHKEFFEALTYEVKVHGASRSAHQLPLWEKEIQRMPAILNPKFTLISAFVDDEQIKANLETAIVAHMNSMRVHQLVQENQKVALPNLGMPYDLVTERFRPISVFQSTQWNPDCSQYDYCYKGLIKPSFPYFSDNEVFKSEDTYQRYADTQSYLKEKAFSFTVGGAFYDKNGNNNTGPAGPNGGINKPGSPPPPPNAIAQFGFNLTKTEVYNMTESKEVNIGSNEVVRTLYSVDYFEDIFSLEWPISSQFTSDCKAIGTTYDEKRFAAFVRRYGTHFIHSWTYGGIWNFTLSVNSDTVSKKTSEWVTKKFTAAFNIAKNIALNTTISNSDREEVGDVDFQSSSHNMTQIRGGVQNVDTMAWSASVEQNPEVLPPYSLFMPITTLVQQVNPDGATQLMSYLADYVLYGQVNPNNQQALVDITVAKNLEPETSSATAAVIFVPMILAALFI